ncbi:MAG: hypothetical protein ACRDFB_01225 [Rhabdochlamydiaceae bacterium]
MATKKKAWTEKEKKKIEIAKDVIKSLKVETLVKDTYMNIKWPPSGKYSLKKYAEEIANLFTHLLNNKNDQLQKYIPQLKKNCEVCAIGAFFLSTIDKYNQCRVGDFVDKYCGFSVNTMNTKLRKIFSSRELNVIETAFMGILFNNSYESPLSNSDENDALAFSKKFNNNKKRLKAICQNIIENGTFIPSKSDGKLK